MKRASAGRGAGCVDDNPDVNDASQLGTGLELHPPWQDATESRRQRPRHRPGQAAITCNAHVSSPSALLQDGLLATISLSALAPGTGSLALSANPATGAPSGISRQAAGVTECNVGLTCTGATITVQRR